MRVVKADDYQTWFIEEDGFGILIDPWLDKKLNPESSVLLQRERQETSSLSQKELDQVKTAIVTAPFIDHLHIPSINRLFPNKTKKDKKIMAPPIEIIIACQISFSALSISLAPRLLDIADVIAPPKAPPDIV